MNIIGVILIIVLVVGFAFWWHRYSRDHPRRHPLRDTPCYAVRDAHDIAVYESLPSGIEILAMIVFLVIGALISHFFLLNGVI